MVRKTAIAFTCLMLLLVCWLTYVAVLPITAAQVGQVTPDSTWVQPLYEAFASGQYALTGALVVIVVVALIKRLAGGWWHSDAGGALLALVGASATAMTVALAIPSAHITWTLFRNSLMVGVTAAGGFALVKRLLIDPLIRPLAVKAPPWMQPVFAVVLWAFNKPSPTA